MSETAVTTDPRSAYEATAQALVKRITDCIPANPKILTMKDPFKLFKVPGFKCDDLEPSLAQAMAALMIAQRDYKAALNTPQTKGQG